MCTPLCYADEDAFVSKLATYNESPLENEEDAFVSQLATYNESPLENEEDTEAPKVAHGTGEDPEPEGNSSTSQMDSLLQHVVVLVQMYVFNAKKGVHRVVVFPVVGFLYCLSSIIWPSII